MNVAFIGVDVGTSSVRAAAFNGNGQKLCSESIPIRVISSEHDVYEQSSCEIWQACCCCVKVVHILLLIYLLTKKIVTFGTLLLETVG